MIINCAAYRDGLRAADVSSFEQVGQASLEPNTFAWIGLWTPDVAELSAAMDGLGWDTDLVAEILSPHERPVLTKETDYSHLVLRTARYDDATETVDLGGMSILFTDHAVLTVRHGDASELSRLRETLELDRRLLADGAPAVLAAIVDQVVDDYLPALDGFEQDVLEAEHQVFADTRTQPVQRLYQLKREVLQVLVAIESLTFPLNRLVRTMSARFPAATQADLVETIEQLERTLTRTRSLGDLLDSAINASLTEVSLQQNEDMRKISAWVAMAALPTLIAGIYGMNFETQPELRWRFGYPLIMVIMVVLVASMFRAFRRSGWL